MLPSIPPPSPGVVVAPRNCKCYYKSGQPVVVPAIQTNCYFIWLYDISASFSLLPSCFRQISVYHVSCFISVCPFIALSKARFAENLHILLLSPYWIAFVWTSFVLWFVSLNASTVAVISIFDFLLQAGSSSPNQICFWGEYAGEFTSHQDKGLIERCVCVCMCVCVCVF